MAVPSDMLLYPELLTNEQLTYIIEQRHLKLHNIHNMIRDELLQVYHQFCMPYAQRKFRDSGRGKILNNKRERSPEGTNNFNTINTSSNKRCTNNDRIKPPPDLLSGHMKRIKIENKTGPNSNVNVNKRKMSIDPPSLTNNTPPPKKEKKPITWP